MISISVLGTIANIYFSDSDIDRKSTRLNSSHLVISYAVFCLKKKKAMTLEKARIAKLCSPFFSSICRGDIVSTRFVLKDNSFTVQPPRYKYVHTCFSVDHSE